MAKREAPKRLTRGPIGRISNDRLEALAAETLAEPASVIPRSLLMAAYDLSLRVLAEFFSAEWVEHFVYSGEAKTRFLARTEASFEALVAHEFTVLRLAEMMFNFQDHDGFLDCATKIRSGDIAAMFSELETGQILTSHKADFRFVAASQGNSYDILITYPDGRVACADSKCKVRTLQFSEPTLKSSLNHARRQLPGDKPGIAFVKTPSRWLDQPGVSQAVEATLENYFRNNTRVVMVVFYVSEVGIRPDGMLFTQVGNKEYESTKHKFEEHRGKSWSLLSVPLAKIPIELGEEMWINMPDTWVSLARKVQS